MSAADILKINDSAREDLLRLARETHAYAFIIDGKEYSNQSQLFIITNEKFVTSLENDRNLMNRFSCPFISSTHSKPSLWDQGKPYLKKFENLPWNRDWHILFILGNTIYNDSLLKITKHDNYSKNFFAASRREISPDLEYDWMNLIIEPMIFFPEDTINVLRKVMDLRVRSSEEIYNKMLSEGINGKTGDILFQYMDNGNSGLRKEIYDFLLGLGIIDVPGEISESLKFRLPSHIWKYTFDSEEELKSLKTANCLGLLYWFGESKFLESVGTVSGKESEKTVREFAIYTGLLDASLYSYGKLLNTLVLKNNSNIVLLTGVHPDKYISSSDDLKNYRIPFDMMPYTDKKVADMINDPAKREIVSFPVNQ